MFVARQRRMIRTPLAEAHVRAMRRLGEVRDLPAGAVLQDFGTLIMDESLANVDEITKEKIIQKIKEMFSNRCFLYISHNVVEVAKYCDQILVLRSHHKDPQAVLLQGQDFNGRQPLAERDLEQSMLEIVNAT